MRRARTCLAVAPAVATLALGGCGGSSAREGRVLGRTFGAEGVPAVAAPAPQGDPVPERGGTVAAHAAVREDAIAPAAAAPTPRAALRRYALAYANWTAAELPARERELAALSVGPARLAAEQIAASRSANAALAADHVENRGVVLSIAKGQGLAQAEWVVVTEEQTSGSGAYAGLPAGVHVTVAGVVRTRGGWAVGAWSPRA
jgi:hypothetical protein